MAAVNHKGLAFIDVLQPCPTYNDLYTRDWFGGLDQINEETKKPTPRIYNLADVGYDPVVHYSTTTELNEKLAQALDITKEHYGIDLTKKSSLYITEGIKSKKIIASQRIGITKAVDKLWNFKIKI